MAVSRDAHYFLAFHYISRYVLASLKRLLRNHLLTQLHVEFKHRTVRRSVDIFSGGRLRVALRKKRHVKLSQTLGRLNSFALFLLALISRRSHSREKLNFLVHFKASVLCGLRKLA